MDIYFTSFLLYAIPVNLLAITIMIMGKRKLQVEWLPIEYFFIYLPWLAFIALATTVFGSLDQVPGHSSLRAFVMILQSILLQASWEGLCCFPGSLQGAKNGSRCTSPG